jgi:BON domain-containing protein
MSISQLTERTTKHLQDSDADLSLRLRAALSVQRRAGWHLVRHTVKNGVVRLEGDVPTFYDRQLIVALVRRVAGVYGIEDNLKVGDPSIRQQVIDDETILLPAKSTTAVDSPRDPFRHVPVLAHSLDDIHVGSAFSVLHAT